MSSGAVYTCKICGNDRGNVIYTAREMMYGLRDTFTYFQCNDCECLQIAEFPAGMSRYYPSNYYSFNAYDGKKFRGFKGKLKRMQYRAAVDRKGLIQKLWTLFFDVPDYRIFQGLGVNSQTKILDVGCGNGRSFLYPLAEIGFQNLLGCDPFLDADIHYANGLKIRKASVFEVDGQWDIITYHHSFEHVPDPFENLLQVAKLLRPGGVCIIRIPTCSSYAWEHYRTNWAQLDAPRHFFLHSRKDMGMLADMAGLELYKVVDDSRHFQFSGSEKYVADTALTAPREKGVFRFLTRKFRKWSYTRRAKQLNKQGRGDQAGFFLRK
ncbi:MAG: class I SAM-dependent methyltransferase [Bacteroidia bacterium]